MSVSQSKTCIEIDLFVLYSCSLLSTGCWLPHSVRGQHPPPRKVSSYGDSLLRAWLVPLSQGELLLLCVCMCCFYIYIIRVFYIFLWHCKFSSIIFITLWWDTLFSPSQDISDIKQSTKRREYRGQSVTRREMMEILRSLETLMIRARYHTVQIEGVWVLLKS